MCVCVWFLLFSFFTGLEYGSHLWCSIHCCYFVEIAFSEIWLSSVMLHPLLLFYRNSILWNICTYEILWYGNINGEEMLLPTVSRHQLHTYSGQNK
jgi:hypothetical protein